MAKTNNADLLSALSVMLAANHVHDRLGQGGAATVANNVTSKPAKPAANVAGYTARPCEPYKGSPMVEFSAPGRRPIKMGHGKIRLVLAHADALRKIVG